MTPELIASLQKLRKTLVRDIAPVLEAEDGSAPDVGQAFNAYVLGVLDEAVASYGVDFEMALDRFFDVVAGLEEDGDMPPMPDASATDPESLQALSTWLGAAATLQLGQLVLATLEDEGEGE